MMIGPRNEIARMQSDFYRDCYHRVLRWLFIEIVIIFLLLGGIIYLVSSSPSPQYYATMIGGQIRPLPSGAS